MLELVDVTEVRLGTTVDPETVGGPKRSAGMGGATLRGNTSRRWRQQKKVSHAATRVEADRRPRVDEYE